MLTVLLAAPSEEAGHGRHPRSLTGLAEHLDDPPVEEGQFDPHSARAGHVDQPSALAGPLPVLSEQALHDPKEQAGHGGYLEPLAGLAGDDINRNKLGLSCAKLM